MPRNSGFDGSPKAPGLPAAEGRPSDEELKAIRRYTSSAYSEINGYLRGNTEEYYESDSKSLQETADRISAGLAKLPKHTDQVYRGVYLDDKPDILARYQVGQTVTEVAFSSSSTDPKVAIDFLGADTVMIIDGHSGVDISAISKSPAEAEILFDKGTEFMVTDRIENDPATGKRIIRMTEVGR